MIDCKNRKVTTDYNLNAKMFLYLAVRNVFTILIKILEADINIIVLGPK